MLISHHLLLSKIYVSKNIVADLVKDKLIVVYAERSGIPIMFNSREVVALNQILWTFCSSPVIAIQGVILIASLQKKMSSSVFVTKAKCLPWKPQSPCSWKNYTLRGADSDLNHQLQPYNTLLLFVISTLNLLSCNNYKTNNGVGFPISLTCSEE